MALVVLVTLPAPATVRSKPAVAMAPLTVRVPAVLVSVLAPPRVIAPDQVLALATLRRAPALLTPVPMRLAMGSAMVRPEPSISMAAPLATLVVPAAVPRAAADWTRMMPALTVVAPV